MVNDKINVFIVDDHSVVRKGLKMFLEADKEIEICGDTDNLNDAVEIIGRKKPDVVLLDYKLPDGDGITGCLTIKRMYPGTKVIILSAFDNKDIILGAARAGADAYLLKDIESEQLISSIFSVLEGKAVLGSSVVEQVSNNLSIPDRKLEREFKLSSKETEILEMIALGRINKEIAHELKISEKTVRNYISRIFKKINVTNRTEAAGFWIRQQGESNIYTK